MSEEIYSENELIKWYMNNIRKGAKEEKVDNLWAQILSFYWPTREKYGVERETHIAKHSQMRANVILTKIKDDKLKRCLYVECKRPTKSISIEPTKTEWENAIEQLQGYIDKGKRHNLGPNLYAIVGIGVMVRFFVLHAGQKSLQTYGGTASLSIKKDHMEVHRILTEIRQRLTL
ncbi:unnamed protein product [Penicillium glandicola]